MSPSPHPERDAEPLLSRDTLEEPRAEVVSLVGGRRAGSSVDEPTTVSNRPPSMGSVGDHEETVAEAPRVLVDPKRAPLEADTSFAERYVPGKLLGQGGMGTIRLHEDRQIGRHVAIKRVREDQGHGPLIRQRFLREARIQGQLEHPSVVPVYDLALDHEGRPFFSMRRVRGLTLEAVLERLQIGAPEAFRKAHSRRRLLAEMSRLCLAVHYAHEHGVLHRDLKPSNVILGEFGEIYLLDWGLAGLAKNASEAPARPLQNLTLSRQTRPGSVIGTYGYMSPEQATASGELGAASDVYSLGALLFEVLTLTPLHAGESDYDKIRSTIDSKERRRRPSRRAPERRVPLALEEIVVKATEPLARDRYASARELHEAIESYLDGRRDQDGLERRASALAATAIEAAQEIPEGLSAQKQRLAVEDAIVALSLDPGNPEIVDTLSKLMRHTPEELPTPITRALQSSRAKRLRWIASASALAYAATFGYLPFLAAAGVRSWAPVVIPLVAMLASGILCLVVARQRVPSQNLLLGAMLVSTAGLAGSAPWLGPLLLTPSLIALNAMPYGLYLDRRGRQLTLGVSLSALAVCLALGAAGILGSDYTFTDGVLEIHSGALHLMPAPTYGLLILLAVAQVTLAVVVGNGLRRDLEHAERAALLRAWLVSGSARAPSADDDGSAEPRA